MSVVTSILICNRLISTYQIQSSFNFEKVLALGKVLPPVSIYEVPITYIMDTSSLH